MEEMAAWSFQLSAECRHVPTNPSSRCAAVCTTQPCMAKTGNAEVDQQFSSLRPKAKLNQALQRQQRHTQPQQTPKAETCQGQPGSTATSNVPPLHQCCLCPNLSTNPSILCVTVSQSRFPCCSSFVEPRQVGQLGGTRQPAQRQRAQPGWPALNSKCLRHPRHPALRHAHSDSQHPFQLPKLFNKPLVDFRLEISQGCLDWELIQWQTSGFEKDC